MAQNVTNAEAIDRAQADPHQVHEHHVHGGPKIYGLVLASLLVLTAITVAASTIHFGSGMANVVIAMLIASVKASLVVLFFMHLRWDKPMNAVIFCSSLFFLALFLIGCYTDNTARPPIEPTNLKAQPGTTGAGTQTPAGQLAPAPGHGTPGAMSPTGGGQVIPGASPEGSHGGATTGTAQPPPAQPPHK
jgi:cytochrome c oxidase subunit IV